MPSSDCTETCRAELRAIWEHVTDGSYQRMGIPDAGNDINISTMPPLFYDHRWPPEALECQHGVVFWLTPTNEQVMEWNRLGTP